MAEKRYTQAEANSLLPYLAPTLVELREKFEAAARDQAGGCGCSGIEWRLARQG